MATVEIGTMPTKTALVAILEAEKRNAEEARVYARQAIERSGKTELSREARLREIDIARKWVDEIERAERNIARTLSGCPVGVGAGAPEGEP